MNYQDTTLDDIAHQRPHPRPRPQPQPPQFWSPRSPSVQSQSTIRAPAGPARRAAGEGKTAAGLDLTSSSSDPQLSLSPQPTIIPHAPTPPWDTESTPSYPGQYGDDRLFAEFGHPLIDNRPRSQPPRELQSAESSRLDRARLAMDQVTGRAQARGFRDELTLAAGGSITPGVDDGPFIVQALDAMTTDTWPSFPRSPSVAELNSAGRVRYSLPGPSSHLQPTNSVYRSSYHDRITGPDFGLGLLPPLVPSPAVLTHDRLLEQESGLLAYATTAPLPPLRPETFGSRTPSDLNPGDLGALRVDEKRKGNWDPNSWVPISEVLPIRGYGKPQLDILDPSRERYPRINFLPGILRLSSLVMLMTLCLMMVILLGLSAGFSMNRSGLLELGVLAPENVHGGQYFLFRILPQTVAAIIFVYAQCVMTATVRILPFATITDDDMERRRDGLFAELYPTSFLLPHITGPPIVKASLVLIWLSVFTIPLSAAAFTISENGGELIWMSVLPIIWALVALYGLLLVATIMLAVYWRGRITGLMWDPRSISDIALMLYDSNTLADYDRTETMEGPKDIAFHLHARRFDRLGYWMKEDVTVQPWYGIGITSNSINSPPLRDFEHTPRTETDYRESIPSLKGSITPGRDDHGRFWYLPGCLRSIQMVFVVFGSTSLLLALIIVTFVNGLGWTQGFDPGQLSVAPGRDGFAAGNFVYSFVPSCLGMFLYLPFQGLDQTLRTLQPWAELSKGEPVPATRSILLDYAACLPLQSTLRAFQQGHWRIFAVSLASALSIFIPILAGGIFVPSADGNSIQPNEGVYFVVLALLILFFFALISCWPNRDQYRLPHGVTRLCDIISFLCTDDVKESRAFSFKGVRSRQMMLKQLGIGGRRMESKWFFGPGQGSDVKVGLRRQKLFTEKPKGSPYV